MEKIRVAIIGLGRIGQLHLNNLLSSNDCFEVAAVSDPVFTPEELVLSPTVIFSLEPEHIISLPSIDAVFVCTPIGFHVDYVQLALEQGKHVFCEKPVSHSCNALRKLNALAKKSGKVVQVGFNRRFDPNFKALADKLQDNLLGDIYSIRLTSYDPILPSRDYLKKSGGIFRDMMIHDFDMASFLLTESFSSVYSQGDSLIDETLNELPDYDVALTTLVSHSGVLVNIENSRKAAHGYDQRIEVHGSEGNIIVENQAKNILTMNLNTSTVASSTENSFISRYSSAYRAEIESFYQSIKRNVQAVVGLSDAYTAMSLAETAIFAAQTGKQQVVMG